jgi:hypothetical protein
MRIDWKITVNEQLKDECFTCHQGPVEKHLDSL